MMDKVSFTQMKDGTREEYEFLTAHEIDHTRHTADRLLKALVALDESLSGYQITRLGHSLQSATRAWRDGADVDWVVAALLHDTSLSANASLRLFASSKTPLECLNDPTDSTAMASTGGRSASTARTLSGGTRASAASPSATSRSRGT